ncbi:MAG TPA: 2-oxoacid:acceptor oxidoreductase subunit alpha [Candidatus Thermoplasmatota archaeon]|nr:2-oxoacid:acceptor oxidoreductase subunit alpha [Candidatus Thermoplasmatota archaeon]
MASPIVNHVSWRIGGQQGEGIDSTGDIFTKAIARYGLHLYTYRSFSSRIRGGLTFFEVRIRDHPVAARPDTVDVVLALGQEVIDATLETISDGAIILYDSDAFTPTIEGGHKDKVHLVGVPMTKIAEANGSKIMRNMVGLGATAALLGMELDPFFEFVQERFGKKGEKVVNMNKAVITAGRDAVKDTFTASRWKLERRPLPATGRRMVINGNAALSFGALVGGTRFIAGYPITPATDVMEWFIDNGEDHHAAVIQTEDELAAVNMILGASYAGVRALTATSGPGLSLMTEAIGLAGMAEHPIMIVDVMRPGPSTGLPTKHSQADLNFAVYGGHDDFPRIVCSPTTVEEAFYLVQHALNWMEEYQVPVFFLIDQDLAIANSPIDALDVKRVKIRRGKLLTREQAAQFVPDTYKRYEFTDDGVSTRTIPGYPNTLFLSSGSESDDRGVITENRTNRNRKMEKRQLKLDTFAKRAPKDTPFVEVHGTKDAKIGVITWGSTTAVVDEATARMTDLKTKRMAIKVLWPFPSKEVKDFMAGCDKVFVVESNFSGQLAELVKKEIGGHEKVIKILKYDGTPFRPSEIVNEIQEAL